MRFKPSTPLRLRRSFLAEKYPFSCSPQYKRHYAQPRWKLSNDSGLLHCGTSFVTTAAFLRSPQYRFHSFACVFPRFGVDACLVHLRTISTGCKFSFRRLQSFRSSSLFPRSAHNSCCALLHITSALMTSSFLCLLARSVATMTVCQALKVRVERSLVRNHVVCIVSQSVAPSLEIRRNTALLYSLRSFTHSTINRTGPPPSR